MDRTNIPLERRQTETLDRLAADEGVSRAEIIRRLLDRALNGPDASLDSDLEAIEGSFGSVPFGAAPDVDVDAPDRGLGEREEHLARIRQRT